MSHSPSVVETGVLRQTAKEPNVKGVRKLLQAWEQDVDPNRSGVRFEIGTLRMIGLLEIDPTLDPRLDQGGGQIVWAIRIFHDFLEHTKCKSL